MNFKDYIHQETQIDNETLTLLDNLFKPKEYKKYSFLLKKGCDSKQIFYIEKGIIRAFYNKGDKDITHGFYAESMFYMPIENIYFKRPFHFCLEALEDCYVRVAEFSEVEKIISQKPDLERFMRFLLISAIKNLTDKLYAIKFQPAQERYQLLLENYPQIILRVSLGHIASLLGITQQTLSVIRAGK